MSRFSDLITTVGVGDDGITPAYPDDFTSALTAAYDEDMAAPAAAIQVKDAEILALKEQITMLQAHNYVLLTQVPSEGDNGPTVEDEPEEPEDDPDDEVFPDDDDNE